MPGVRIRHVTERSCTYTLVDASRPLAGAMLCGSCGRVHTFKTYHLALDDNGCALVSIEIAEKVGRLGPGTGFTVMNEVKAPPTQTLAIGTAQGVRLPIFVDPRFKEPY